MGVIVTFNYNAWTAMFPEFTTTVNAAQAQAFFNIATVFHRNDGCGPVNDLGTQSSLLNMLTAHIAALMTPDSQGNPPSPVVGRIASFSEGSASGTAEYQGPQAASWYITTRYGALYWEATALFRTARYVRGRQRPMGTGPFGYGASFPSAWI